MITGRIHYAEIIAGIERGLADVAAGRTVPHDEAMAEIRATIEEATDRGDDVTALPT